MAEQLQCEYADFTVVKKGKDLGECIGQMQLHHNAIHLSKAPAAAVKPEEKERKTERQKMKPPTFTEQETREEFLRKNSEFNTYSARAKLKPEEISEDLFYACETPLKRKLRASNVVNRTNLGKTDPKALLAEIERICTPKTNRLVEREQFKHLEQGEDESITNFESRVRAKAFLCDFNCCKSTCKEDCLTHTKCGFSREEDEIITQILCRMKDKDLQKDLWAKNEEHEDLAKVLATIRASEAAGDSQAAFGSESGSAAFKKMKCHKCGKWGHSSLTYRQTPRTV